MTHTPQSHPLPNLEAANPEAGDVAVCGAFDEEVPSGLSGERIAFVAPLACRPDLDALLRGLLQHPGIRHLVVCGDDPRATGEALLALWEEGLDADGRVPGPRGRLAPELDAATVDRLRRYVQISDCREQPFEAVAERVAGLPPLPREQEAQAVPGAEIPKRKVFLSRRTSFPVFANDVPDSWLQLLNLTLRIGTDRRLAGGEPVAEALNVVVTVGLPVLAEDLEVEVAPPVEFPAYLDFDRADFERFYAPLAAGLGRRLRDWDGRDQLVLQPDDATAVPDLLSATFDVVEGTLYGSFVLRGADVYSDWPLEAMALVNLQRELAERLGLEAGAATFVIHAARLRARDWERAERLLKEAFKRPLPLQVDHSGIFLFGNDGGQARAMLLDHDAGTIFWEDAFSNPEDLSWYIVDVMPWLLPQHIRYVGQECASLMRAIREGECYLQG